MSFSNYFKALRLPFITASTLNFVIYWLSLTKEINSFFYLGLLGIILAHLAGNLWNDFFDFESDKYNTTPTPFSGGSRFLQSNLISKKNFFIFSLIISFFALIIGLIILLNLKQNQLKFISIVSLSAFLTFFYTAPPLKFVYRRVGELAIVLTFGPLILIGISLMNSIEISIQPFFISLIFGILTARILFNNQILDSIPDLQSGKKTLANKIPQNKLPLVFALFSFSCLVLFYFSSSGWIFLSSILILILTEIFITFIKKPIFCAAMGLISHLILAILWIVYLS